MDEWKRTSSGEEEKQEKQKLGWMQGVAGLGRKKEVWLLFLVGMGIMALIWPQKDEGAIESAALPVSEEIAVLEDTRHQLTAEVQKILSGIEGIGKVEVCLTLDSDGVREYAVNQTEETKENREPSQGGSGIREEKTASVSTDVAVSGGNALVIENRYPKVVGVLVVAEGANNAVMQQKICDAVAVLLDVSPHRVRVLGGREESL